MRSSCRAGARRSDLRKDFFRSFSLQNAEDGEWLFVPRSTRVTKGGAAWRRTACGYYFESDEKLTSAVIQARV
jgi:hypothetical protein